MGNSQHQHDHYSSTRHPTRDERIDVKEKETRQKKIRTYQTAPMLLSNPLRFVQLSWLLFLVRVVIQSLLLGGNDY